MMKTKKQIVFVEGPKAQRRFERAMKKAFRATKPAANSKPKKADKG
jgi:hypothetical protein